MKFFYNTELDQLRCNFCTRWFSCGFHFANVQRNSLNACVKCIQNFTYSIVHPENFQVYQVVIVNSGFSVGIAQLTIQERLEGILRRHKNSKNLPSHIQQTVRQFHADIADINSQMEMLSLDCRNRNYENFGGQMHDLLREWQRMNEDLGQSSRNIRDTYDLMMKELQQDIANHIHWNQAGNQYHYILSQLSLFKQTLTSKTQNNTLTDHPNHNKENVNGNARLKHLKNKIFGSNQQQQSINKMHSHLNTNASSVILKSQRQHARKSSCLKRQSHLKKSTSSQCLPLTYSIRSNEQKCQKQKILQMLVQKQQFPSYFAKQVIRQEAQMKKQNSRKNMAELVMEMKQKTNVNGNLMQLIGCNVGTFNLQCYLRAHELTAELKVIRFISNNMVDADFNHILHFLSKQPQIEIIIVTNNRLTELSVASLIVFKQRHCDSKLKWAYFGNNFVKHSRAQSMVYKLKQKGIQVFL